MGRVVGRKYWVVSGRQWVMGERWWMVKAGWACWCHLQPDSAEGRVRHVGAC